MEDVPPPPPGKTGWPWTEAPPPIGETRPDGAPWPKITIVTPSFNYGHFLEETIRSVVLQGYPNLEYFVVDGGSTDESVAIIERYSDWITYWRSQKDGGQADAINYALSLATGVWFHNVNADDLLAAGALAAIGAAPLTSDLVAGNVIHFDGATRASKCNPHDLKNAILKRRPADDSVSWQQPGVVFKADKLRDIGGYPLEFDYVFDHHATCLYLDRYDNQYNLNREIVLYRTHDGQKTFTFHDLMLDETISSHRTLAQHLVTPALKSAALRTSSRSMLYRCIRRSKREPHSSKQIRQILRFALAHPWLIANRFFLGDVRRNWRRYLSAIVN